MPAELGRAGVSQTYPLQQARQRWTLPGVGTAATLHVRVAHGVQITARRQNDGSETLISKRKSQTNPVTNMKTMNQTQLNRSGDARRSLTTRTVIASLALATAVLPARADNGPASKEDRAPIRPFHVNVPKAELTELRKRIQATKWPARELVTDASQGVQLATMRKLARYWATDYDWRKGEAKLKAVPHFITEIDGLDIHFIHVRSKHENALPMIVTHGWPGSIIEQMKIIEPLTNPT